MTRWLRWTAGVVVAAGLIFLVAAFVGAPAALSRGSVQAGRPAAEDRDTVQYGRYLVISHDCGGCHGGGSDPTANGWLAGMMVPEQEFAIGPFKTRPRNLTPDNATGMGRFTERQIFNALRYGLRPEDTPDVAITSATPGEGNFPAHPRYLAVPMPWPAFRHMPDGDLWAIAAYLKRGVKPVSNKVADSDGPPDFWASEYTVAKIGAYPAPTFPTAKEAAPQ
jgi:mono/diheme cytochrome c family protein